MSSNKISDWFFQYNKDIYHFLLYYVGSGDIEDLVQEVFIRAIKGFDDYQWESSPKTWLFSIARNVGRDEIRKRARKRFRMNKDNFLSYHESTSEMTPEKVLQLNEKNKQLYKAIRSLKSNYRDVIILRAIKEQSVSETAAILNWNENKVRITYHRALKTLERKKEEIDFERE
ncbi:RNA polymerase sigma factor [Salirhabdus sp. Marseille-P4669]|uniref:RNA polymerase sigma factor n=1 Tax=Salirhabdus sp. Marseille-P4669 TaxID=2042310 RepID=UPI000C7C6BEF|nr:RNA polymerase sigma factor [Salirhabdus sp. Marseille-P4669]